MRTEIRLKGELISEITDEEEIDDEETDLIIEEFELDQVELEKRYVKNIREKTALLLELTDQQTHYYYNFPPRPKFEVRGGYKIATHRGARLNEANVFNLYFRFVSQKINADAIAVMYRPQNTFKEIILLLPDDTSERIKRERSEFMEEARYFTMIRQIMNPDHQNFLIENLKKLNINERCAQSLMHEYGHALHWRMFDDLNIQYDDDIYIWFYDNKYVHNIDKRFPYFKSLTSKDKITKLKESLVEDYRISLNKNTENGMFILPNRISYQDDFVNPELLEEGVSIMKKMLKPALEGKAIRKIRYSSEIDTIQAIREARIRARRSNWIPGTPSMTDKDHLEVINQLQDETTRSQAAVTKHA